MNDIQQIVDNFLLAAERLERLTVDINVMADQLEPALRGAGQVKGDFTPNYVNQTPTAATNYPPLPAGPPAFVTPPVGQNPQQTPPSMPAQPPQAPAQAQYAPPAPEQTAPVHPEATADTFAPEPVAQQTPWEAQAAAPAPVAEAEPEKKSGRRTNEDIARELGVDLDKVKAWKGGGRISKKDMEEYKTTHPEEVNVVAAPAPAVPEQPSNPFGGAAQAAPAPSQPAQAQYAPPAPTAPQPVAAPAQGAPQEWPAVGQPATPPAPAQNPGEVYGDWPTVEGNGFNPSNPFGG